MITKQHASEAFGYGYRIELNGDLVTPYELRDNWMLARNKDGYSCVIYFKDFGTDAFILCRPFSHLTKEITVEGETFVPIVELAKIAYPMSKWVMRNGRCEDNKNWSFTYSYGAFKKLGTLVNLVPDQTKLFTKLKQWHFSFFDDSVVKWME